MNSSSILRLVFVFLFLSFVWQSAVVRTETRPWDDPEHGATPEEMLRAAGEVPVDEEYGIQVLLDEGRFLLDEAGRIDYRFRIVFRVDSPAAVGSWSRVSHSWRPWYQDRPEIRGRVITPDGAEHFLDPANLGEYSQAEDGPDVYGDTKSLKGPLPAVKVGAVVEELHVVRDREPAFGDGVIRTFVIGRKVPVLKTRVIIEAPTSIPLNYKVHRLPDLEPTRETVGDRVRLTFEVGPMEAWQEDVRNAPGDIARRPVVRFSTGSSWNAIASAYADLVDRQIEASDLRKLTRKAIGRETERERILNLLLETLHEKVRYTGIEFGEQSIVPSEPALTLERRFGDCKDKSTLLVSMLRQVGIEAHVALLNTGPGSDVDVELPGMGRFDHAIVHVAGSPETWIDPTNRFARAGELPSSDQGRLALVASKTTSGLVTIPTASPSDNRRRELRQIVFAREGAGTVIEMTEVWGSFERSFRRSFSKKNETGLRDQLERYVKSQYLAEELGEMEISDPEDLSQPMTVRIEAEGSKRVWTTATDASTVISPGALIRNLPKVLKPDDGNEDEEDEPRKHPVFLQQPYIAEIRYEIEPPPGYALTSAPESGQRQFGPAVLTHDYNVADDGTVTAELRFDTVKTVYTTEEAIALKEALDEFYEEQMPRVLFHQVGEAHLEAGRIREALQEFQSLVERFPDEALYRTQVARAYLAAGLGGSARREAARAVELDPQSAVANRTLGFILAHDLLGRKFVEGFDFDGAEAALRQAKQLDSEDFLARGELAILLEHDSRGERYGRRARLDEAIAEYRALRTDLENEGLTPNLMAALLNAGKFAEVHELWDEAPRDATTDALYLAAIAMIDGPDAAVRKASELADQAETYRGALRAAGDWLNSTRHYPESAALLSAGARGASDSVSQLAAANLIRRVKRHETQQIVSNSPEGLVLSFLVAVFSDHGSDTTGLEQMFLSSLVESAKEGVVSERLDDLHEQVLWSMRQEGLSGDRALDWMVSLTRFSVDGDPETGYRVRVRFFATDSSAEAVNFYLVRQGEQYRLVGTAETFGMIGQLLLGWVEQERLEPARQWLDWLVEDTYGGTFDDVLSGPPLQRLWEAGQQGGAEQIRLAAASLMADGTYGSKPLPILEEGRTKVTDERVRVGLDMALVGAAQESEEYEIALRAATRLVEAFPRSTTVFAAKILALIELERFDEAEQELSRRLERFPGETLTATVYADLPQMKGDLEEHRRRLVALIDSARATAGEYNNLAWLDIVQGRVTEETLHNVQQSVAMTDYAEVASLHTLATVFAELGMVAEARDVLLALIDNRTSNELESPDWYVLGRIAEHYGAPDAAVEAYEKVEPDEDGPYEESSTYRLAARRLAMLQDGDKK